jgi:hypothetical protein
LGDAWRIAYQTTIIIHLLFVFSNFALKHFVFELFLVEFFAQLSFAFVRIGAYAWMMNQCGS